MFVVSNASTHPVTHVVFNPAGNTFAVVQPNYGVTLIERGSNRAVATMQAPRVGDYTSVAFCDGGSKLAVSSSKGIHVFDVQSGNQFSRHGSDPHANALLAARDPGLVAVTAVGLRDIGLSPDPNWTFPGWVSAPRTSEVLFARFHALSADGRWAVARLTHPAPPSLIDLDADAAKAALHHPAPEHDRVRLTATFAPTGGRFAVCDGKDVVVYDAEQDAEIEEPPVPSPDPPDPTLKTKPPKKTPKRKPAAPKPRTVLQPTFVLQRPEGVHPKDHWQPPIAFTNDGRGLLVRRPRNRVQLWDVNSGSQTGEWSWRMDGVMCLAIAPDGLTAVAGARRGQFVVWDLD